MRFVFHVKWKFNCINKIEASNIYFLFLVEQNLHRIPYGLAVRIPGFHPGGPGSTPGMGTALSYFFFKRGQSWFAKPTYALGSSRTNISRNFIDFNKLLLFPCSLSILCPWWRIVLSIWNIVLNKRYLFTAVPSALHFKISSVSMDTGVFWAWNYIWKSLCWWPLSVCQISCLYQKVHNSPKISS